MRWSMNASCEAATLAGLVHICACGTGPNEREGTEGAVGGALVCEERLVCHQPEVRLVLTVLRKAVHPLVAGGGGALSPFCAETKTEGT
jgi:hypothetical protein